MYIYEPIYKAYTISHQLNKAIILEGKGKKPSYWLANHLALLMCKFNYILIIMHPSLLKYICPSISISSIPQKVMQVIHKIQENNPQCTNLYISGTCIHHTHTHLHTYLHYSPYIGENIAPEAAAAITHTLEHNNTLTSLRLYSM